MKKIVIISLGGSVIIPDKINLRVLRELKKIIEKNTKKYKFVIVCGGGKTARTYINGLLDEEVKDKEHLQSMLGIAATKLNARFVSYLFSKPFDEIMPNESSDVEQLLGSNDIVICGGFNYSKKETSDSNAAKLAKYFESDFINITDIAGLYDKDPKKYRNAVFIPEISAKSFYKKFKKLKYKPGQHFILDQKAAKIIKKNKITTYLIGSDSKNLDNLLNKKHFIGTIIN
jgi:uridylate kinase